MSCCNSNTKLCCAISCLGREQLANKAPSIVRSSTLPGPGVPHPTRFLYTTQSAVLSLHKVSGVDWQWLFVCGEHSLGTSLRFGASEPVAFDSDCTTDRVSCRENSDANGSAPLCGIRDFVGPNGVYEHRMPSGLQCHHSVAPTTIVHPTAAANTNAAAKLYPQCGVSCLGFRTTVAAIVIDPKPICMNRISIAGKQSTNGRRSP